MSNVDLFVYGVLLKDGHFTCIFAVVQYPILEFVGLRPKMYSIQPLEGAKKATAKGVDRKVRDENLSHQDYKKSLFGEQQFTHSMVRITLEQAQNLCRSCVS